MAERSLSVFGGNAVLLFLMPARVGGGGGVEGTLLLENAETKIEVASNSEEVKLIEDKGYKRN